MGSELDACVVGSDDGAVEGLGGETRVIPTASKPNSLAWALIWLTRVDGEDMWVDISVDANRTEIIVIVGRRGLQQEHYQRNSTSP